MRLIPTPTHPVLILGSSIMAEWSDRCAQDLAPWPVVNRAVCGWTTGMLRHDWENHVRGLQPAALLCYIGSNDIGLGSPERLVIEGIEEIAARWRGAFPKAPFVYLSVLRAPEKRARLGVVHAVNRAVAAASAADPLRGFIDLNPAVEDSAGRPLMYFYREDGLHYHPSAYPRFGRRIREALGAAEFGA